jgi:hypothetical protein
MAPNNAERQRHRTEQPRIHYRRSQDRRSRPQRWRDAVQTPADLQAECRAGGNLPNSLQAAPLAERLEVIGEYDLGDPEALEPPRGFGRD